MIMRCLRYTWKWTRICWNAEKQDAVTVDDDVPFTWMQNVHDANDAKMTIAEMLRDEMQSAHDANDAEVLSADMSSAHYWAPPLVPPAPAPELGAGQILTLDIESDIQANNNWQADLIISKTGIISRPWHNWHITGCSPRSHHFWLLVQNMYINVWPVLSIFEYWVCIYLKLCHLLIWFWHFFNW